MTNIPAEPIRVAAVHFLRGGTSVVEFTHAFRAATSEVAEQRPLDGVEIVLFRQLERWEESGWRDRPAVVDDIRSTIRQFADER